jgi:Leucine Rich repeats (2 copies)
MPDGYVRATIAVGVLAGIAGLYLLGIGLSPEWKDQSHWPQIGMAISVVGLIACTVWWYSKSSDDAPYLARLAALGWTIKPSLDGIQFEIADRALPQMKGSADLFRQLRRPFNLHFQNVTGLEGIHYLSDIEGCTDITISAGEFTDISELRGFTHLPSLGISQVPLNGHGTVDPSPLSSLINLRRLNLNGTRIRSVEFLIPLTKITYLNLGQTLVTDISPVGNLTLLESVDVRGTRIADLRPLAKDQHLTEISIGGEQIPSLDNLDHLNNLKDLSLIDQGPLDLTTVGALVNLESLGIWGPSQLNVGALHHLGKLQKLTISGFGLASITGILSPVAGIEAIGELTELRILSLGHLQIADISFLSKLHKLTELDLGQMPIQSIAPLRGLKALTKISLIGVPVFDVAVLLELPELNELTILGTPAREDVLTALERRGVKINRL